jgi:hypothetical protein
MKIKMKAKKIAAFADLITAAHLVWGAKRAALMAQLGIKPVWVAFRNQPPFLISSLKGRSV